MGFCGIVCVYMGGGTEPVVASPAEIGITAPLAQRYLCANYKQRPFLNTLYRHLLATCYSRLPPPRRALCPEDGLKVVPWCAAGLAALASNFPFLLSFLQGPLWEQDHRPPPGCVWRPVHPTAPVRTHPWVSLGGAQGGDQYFSGLSDWPFLPLWGVGTWGKELGEWQSRQGCERLGGSSEARGAGHRERRTRC